MALRTRLAVAGVMLILAGVAAAADDTPQFADYPPAARFAGRNAAPVLTTPEAQRFRTRIREAAPEKPNFDGHYIVAAWGCGTDCEMGAIIDAASGRVALLPVVAGTPADAGAEFGHFEYRLGSRLLAMHGMIGEAPPMGSHYFEFDGKRLRPLKTIVKPARRWDGATDGTRP
ncbi:MAG: hypothetical protein ACM3JG_02305 [Thiohalocapsa sp.]